MAMPSNLIILFWFVRGHGSLHKSDDGGTSRKHVNPGYGWLVLVHELENNSKAMKEKNF